MALRYNWKIEQFNPVNKATVIKTLENQKRLLDKARKAPTDSAAGRAVQDIQSRINMLEYYLRVYDDVIGGANS